MARTRVLIMGAAGRDFHNFNVKYRESDSHEVVAFTATQIPNIDGRRYPAALAGRLYPQGIPIYAESELADLIRRERIDEVIFSYSDISHEYVMHRASLVNAAGASFTLLGTRATMLSSSKPVIAICAVRTGCGKSQTTRRVAQILKGFGKKLVAVRHPMPYGDLAAQAVQRFASFADLAAHKCTIEEREEYEPHLNMGTIVYAGVDYAAILARAEPEADIVLWDGGNNDTPFFKPDLHIVVVDPLRPGHETRYHPGETNLRMADVVVINKEASAPPENIEQVRQAVREHNPTAIIVDAASPITVAQPEIIRDRRVLCIEDGPTLTHGGMTLGAGIVAARRFGAKEVVDPRPFLKGSLVETFRHYPGIGILLPAMGYGEQQMRDLEATINATDCDSVIIATPVDLRQLLQINKPSTRVTYELQEIGRPTLADVLQRFA
ncbi:MAG: cyclic 2,3-diphosphoglycerate synthase [candidate division KSB1 bacterium]|nr:cyclic 2,3-diphosphoglycerate synthase [candidate division KSB1 bacterium]MDZ7272476.1 cyclic 2,3-diphosphoglycerate synthase [candidate division KSB1 bacterium]MDZ7284500.1 cyclic 2,3-diphosphoglycerate synthase [candidate division KSB1 bacterium]MDZ7297104.1 cyclic 2,3-diphosphoglycerate synthase [candidate division KSB1 bacterium]MDZ7306552.1 cyclic 2,3-diphosphoglycerate synthase [candidate division KSB1 bacterium]